MTLEDNKKLQVLQNSVLRLETWLCKETPVNTLLNEAKQLSIQQLTAYHSLLSVYKCKQSTQPEYMYNRLFGGNRVVRRMPVQEIRIEFDLSLSRSSFFYRASKLWNAITQQAKDSDSVRIFKRLSKEWIKENINTRP